MMTEEEIRKMLEEKIADLDKVISKIDSEEATDEMYDTANEIAYVIDVIREILGIKT